MTDPIIEAAARAVQKAAEGDLGERDSLLLATAALTAAKPLIRAADVKLIEKNVADLVAMTRAAALEEAAKVAETVDIQDASIIAAHIRALKKP